MSYICPDVKTLEIDYVLGYPDKDILSSKIAYWLGYTQWLGKFHSLHLIFYGGPASGKDYLANKIKKLLESREVKNQVMIHI